MGHLVLGRRDGESITLSPAAGVTAEQLMAALARDGIRVTVHITETNQVRLGIEAAPEIEIYRDELLKGG